LEGKNIDINAPHSAIPVEIIIDQPVFVVIEGEPVTQFVGLLVIPLNGGITGGIVENDYPRAILGKCLFISGIPIKLDFIPLIAPEIPGERPVIL
jgi:hypothetical protein